MRDKDLCKTILGIQAPWQVQCVALIEGTEEVRVLIRLNPHERCVCPKCGEAGPRDDTRRRSWRHLDACQFKTILDADVSRMSCAKHGVVQIDVPWAERGSNFTALLEAMVIGCLKEANTSAVARRMRLTWHQVDGIMHRAVRRRLARREDPMPVHIGIDETSFQKRHEYLTTVTDRVSGNVIHVGDDRTKESLDSSFDQLEPAILLRLESISMDMWKPYIAVIEYFVPSAEEKICFDKFHVAKHLGDAVDQVRRQEQRQLLKEGDRSLVRTKYVWLTNPEYMGAAAAAWLVDLKKLALRTARAWALKEHAMSHWGYVSRTWARKTWKAWLSRATRSRLEPIKRVSRMIRNHFDGIINAIVFGTTNATAESVNVKVQRFKPMACGFPNHDRFRTAIYFHLGGLDLQSAAATHTKS